MPSSHLILCHPLLLLPLVPPSIRIFSNESSLCTRPKYWSFGFSISPSNEHPGLISFRMDQLDLLAHFLLREGFRLSISFVIMCEIGIFPDTEYFLVVKELITDFIICNLSYLSVFASHRAMWSSWRKRDFFSSVYPP